MKRVRDTIRSIGRDEAAFVVFVSLLIAVLTSLTGLRAAAYAAGHGLVWVGTRFLSPGDTALYLSEIAQAKAGRFFLLNLFTTETMSGVANVFWWAVGMLARLFSLSPLAAYETSRIALIPALAFTAYGVIAHFFEGKTERALAFFLFMAGSGLGSVYAAFMPYASDVAGRYEWPLDLWVAESNAFLSMVYSPNFIASLALIIASAYLLFVALERGSVRHAVAAGAASLLLFQFHPYHVATLYAVGAAYLFSRAVSRRADRRTFLAFAVYVALSAPSIVYHAVVTYGDPAKGAWFSASDAMLTPDLAYVLIGYGAVVPLAVIGFIVSDRKDERWRFLAIWSVVQALLLYSPLMFQRRLTEGLQFPLTLLATNAIVRGRRALFKKAEPFGTRATVGAGLLLAFMLFSSTAYAAYWSVESQVAYPTTYFMGRDVRDGIAWLSRNAGDGATLAFPGTGNLIVGFGAVRVYAGHWQLTRDLAGKTAEIGYFYSGMSSEERRRFLSDNGIAYVFVGPAEREAGGDGLSEEDGLVKAYSSSTVQIWKTTR